MRPFDRSCHGLYGQAMQSDLVHLPPDYHSHTRLCKHAAGRPVDYARAAVANGLTEMACTEHCPVPEPFSPHVRMTLEEFPVYLEWVEEARAVEGLRVRLGVEADYYEDCEDFLRDWLPRQPLDIVLGSVHYLHYDREREFALTGIWDGADVEDRWETYFERIAKLADTGLYDVVAHLDLPKKYGARPAPAVIERLVKPALDRIAAAGMGIEINTSGFIHPVGEPYPAPDILRWARERDIPLSFGSDSHSPDRMGDHFEAAVRMAIAAGYTERAEYAERKRTLVPLIAIPG